MTRILTAFIVTSMVGVVAHAQEDDDGPLRVMPARDVALQRKKSAPPKLAVEPTTLRAELEQGTRSSAKVTISNAGGRALRWSVPNAPAWARVTPSSGQLAYEKKVTVDVTIDASSLAPGTHTGVLVIAGAETATVTVTLTVLEKPEPKPEPVKPVAGPTPPEKPKTVTEALTKKDEPPTPEPKRHSRKPTPGSSSKLSALGIRGEAVMAMQGGTQRETMSPGVSYGVTYRFGGGASRLSYELGIGFGQAEAESGLMETSHTVARASALLRLSGEDRKGMYVLGGASVLNESVEDQDVGSSSSTGSALDLGVGALFSSIDARLTYSVLLDSENVGGLLGVGVGYVF